MCALVLAAAFVAFSALHTPNLVIATYLVFAATCFTAQMLAASIWPDVIHIRLLAVASAAMNTMCNVGSFAAPAIWGAAKDATGSYQAGLMVLPVAYVAAAILLLNLRRRVARQGVA